MVVDENSTNFSFAVRAHLSQRGLPDSDKDAAAREALWLHVLAIGYSPAYLADNADGIATDWPRVPLPDDRPLFDASVSLGGRVAAILDTRADVPRIAMGTVAGRFEVLGPIFETDLRVSAGWGSIDLKGRISPDHGKTETRGWTEAEKVELKSEFAAAGITESRGFDLLGRAVDVYLNETTYWRGVPEAAWEYAIGGYQVIKTWLSYRDDMILGRALTKDEAREVTGMVRRLMALILMTDELDANYVAVRDKAYRWPSP